MPSILKPTGSTVDINSAASAFGGATLISVVNTTASPALVSDSTTGFDVYLSAGERVFVEKDAISELNANTASGSVYATPVAYKA